MLLLVTGASGVGKSTTLASLKSAFIGRPVTCVDFDDIGVPEDADKTWRHHSVEQWVQRALIEQARGHHLIMCGQVAVGELLAAPSADKLDDLAACMLHCSPQVRRERLLSRGDSPELLDDHIAFGKWFYQHTVNPEHQPHVITEGSTAPMMWKRWSDLREGDTTWDFDIIDTDDLTRVQAAERVVSWARMQLPTLAQ